MATAKNTVKSDNPVDRLTETVRGMMEQYLGHVQAINEFNVPFLADEPTDDSKFTVRKGMATAKEWAERNKNADTTAQELLSDYQTALDSVQDARRKVAEYVAKSLGVTLTVEREKPDADAVQEIGTKHRKPAKDLLELLAQLGKYSPSDGPIINEILEANPLPQVGRRGSLSVGDESSTPKYRIKITVEKEGKIVQDGEGITKTLMVLNSKKNTIHSNKENVPTADQFRKAWESGDKENPVKFTTTDDVTYTISKK